MKVRISGNGGHRDINLPLKDVELAWLIKRVGDGTGNLWCRLEKTWGERNPLQELAGQTVNMDEVNFFAKRMESFTAYEQGVLELYAQEQGLKTMKDLINLKKMKAPCPNLYQLVTDYVSSIYDLNIIYQEQLYRQGVKDGIRFRSLVKDIEEGKNRYGSK